MAELLLKHTHTHTHTRARAHTHTHTHTHTHIHTHMQLANYCTIHPFNFEQKNVLIDAVKIQIHGNDFFNVENRHFSVSR